MDLWDAVGDGDAAASEFRFSFYTYILQSSPRNDLGTKHNNNHHGYS